MVAWRKRLWVLAAVGLSFRASRAEELASPFDVRFEFEGNDGLSSRELTLVLNPLRADLRKQGVDQGAVDDAVYELERHYRSQGYRQARVSAAWEGKGGKYVVRFKVEEGRRSFLEEVTFEGNLFFQASGLVDCFPWLTTKPFGLGKAVFTQDVLDEGIACVITRYQLEGFFFAEASPAISDDGSGQARVRVLVTEGSRIFLHQKPRLEGVRAFSEEEALGALDLQLPTPFVPRLPLVLKGKLIDFYRKRGYRFADVEVERRIDREKKEAMLTLKVREGPLVHIKDVRLQGNKKTWNWVLLQRIKLHAGDLYNEERVRESYRSLLRSGLFSQVNMETKPVEGKEGEVELDVSVSEKARYKASFLLGYGTYELLRGKLVLEDVNLLGTGRRVRVEGRGSIRGEGVSGEYLNPFFFREPLSHRAQGFYDRRENPSFVQRQYGAETGLIYRFRENVQSSLSYRIRQSDAINVDQDVPPEIIDNVLLSSVLVSTVGDFRNSFVDPDRGSTHRLTIEYSGSALGSQLDFLRYTAFSSWVFPLFHGLRLVTAGRVGAIQKLAGTEVIPIQERFFLGGEYTIRSFKEADAGPKVKGKPIGGEAFTYYSVELRFPLFLLKDLHGALFGDTGTLTERVEDIGAGRYFFGAGVGLRYNTPVGPFRFDLAFNPDRKQDEDLFVLNFGLGYPF